MDQVYLNENLTEIAFEVVRQALRNDNKEIRGILMCVVGWYS